MFIKHETTKIPSNVRKIAIALIIVEIIFSIIDKGLAFFLQLGKDQVISKHIIIGLTFIGFYFIRDVIKDFHFIFYSNYRNLLDESKTLAINKIGTTMLFRTRGKVWCENESTGSSEIMSTNVCINSCKNYLNTLWRFKINLPTSIADILALIVSFIGFIKISYSEIEHSLVFITIVIFTSAISAILLHKRIGINDKYYKTRKEADNKKRVLFNDILNIEPLNEEHSKYMENNYSKVSSEIFDNVKFRTFNTGILSSIDGIVSIFATITLIVIKVYEAGLENINLEIVVSIISLLTIYLSVQSSIIHIMHGFEGLIDSYHEIKTYEKDFSKILEVYDSENQQGDDFFAYVSEIGVPKFEVQYPVLNSETPFLLKNSKDLTFKSGDIVLFVGPTGSGKSTLLKLVTNYMKFDSFKLNFKCTNGRIGTVMHQTDGRIGCNDVLSEITIGKQVDTDKLFHILKGLHLYEEISAKDMDVAKYLRNSKINNYSSGQKQRLAIARLLYNLNDDIQIIAFDEATNALNDEITLQTLGFIKEFCRDKILFIATHQVDMGESVANKVIEFVPSGTHYKIKQTL